MMMTSNVIVDFIFSTVVCENNKNDSAILHYNPHCSITGTEQWKNMFPYINLFHIINLYFARFNDVFG